MFVIPIFLFVQESRYVGKDETYATEELERAKTYNGEVTRVYENRESVVDSSGRRV